MAQFTKKDTNPKKNAAEKRELIPELTQWVNVPETNILYVSDQSSGKNWKACLNESTLMTALIKIPRSHAELEESDNTCSFMRRQIMASKAISNSARCPAEKKMSVFHDHVDDAAQNRVSN